MSVHIPKCGGTSFRLVLQEVFGPDRVQLNYNENNEVRRESIPGGTVCIHGHFPATHYDRVFPRRKLVTWFRHPVERVTSNYHQFLRHPDPANPCSVALTNGKLSLEEFAGLDLMRNEATRYMAGKSIDDFAFIGIIERFKESLEIFGRIFGVPVPDNPPMANVNPARQSGNYPISHGTFRRILELNQADLLWYALAAAKIKGRMVAPWI